MSIEFQKDIANAVYAAVSRVDCPFDCANTLLYWGNRIKQIAERETQSRAKLTIESLLFKMESKND